MYEFKMCLKFGTPVILENAGDTIPRKILPIFYFVK